MRTLAAVLLLVLGLAPAAQALTIRDLIELSRAGLGDEVLLALIDVNRGVYAIDAATLISLKAAGVSDRVIAALVRSGREQPPQPPWEDLSEPAGDQAAAPPPQVVVIEHHAAPQVVEVPVAVPVYVTAPPRRARHVEATLDSNYVPFQPGPPAARPRSSGGGTSSVYWGFGGQRRPDAWGAPPGRPGTAPPKRDRDRETVPPRSERSGDQSERTDGKDADTAAKAPGRPPKG